MTEAARGAGRVVLFHVTANADWSNLPLSGLFVDMLRRLVALSAGVATTADTTVLAPAETLDGFGLLSHAAAGGDRTAGQRDRHHRCLAAPSARAVRPGERPARAEPRRQPAGAGGRAGDRRARAWRTIGDAVPERALGPPLLAAAHRCCWRSTC